MFAWIDNICACEILRECVRVSMRMYGAENYVIQLQVAYEEHPKGALLSLCSRMFGWPHMYAQMDAILNDWM